MSKPPTKNAQGSEATDSDALTSVYNIGPASAAAFTEAGIATASELRALGADKAYRQLLLSGVRPHFISYYVLVMGLQGRKWNDCKGAEKDALRVRFDQICSEVKSSEPSRSGALERELRQIGVIGRDKAKGAADDGS